MQGFGPADEVLLFRQKDPKPCLPVRDPSGPTPLQDGSETPSAQTAFAERPIQAEAGAAPKAGNTQ